MGRLTVIDRDLHLTIPFTPHDNIIKPQDQQENTIQDIDESLEVVGLSNKNIAQ